MRGSLNIAAFGDVHFCHHNTPSENIYNELIHAFPYSDDTKALDIIIMEGDWWDKLMPNNHRDTYITEKAMYYLLKLCKDLDITLLIVDGTPSHDAGQAQKFKHFNEESGINADLYFSEEVDIQYIAKHDIHVLFVPDRPSMKPHEFEERITELLQMNHLDKVDIAVMHGCFKYQIPEIADELKHDEEFYQSHVKGCIFIGHIHTASSYGKIIAPGSFSRLSHGEEEPKGHVRVTLSPDNTFQSTFVENKLALLYKTIDVTDMDIESTFKRIKHLSNRYPDQTRIRLQCNSDHPIAQDKTYISLKRSYPQYKWSLKINKSQERIQVEKIAKETEYIPIEINKDNVLNLLSDEFVRRGINPELTKTLPDYVKDLLEAVK